jgi:hypothetical protein
MKKYVYLALIAFFGVAAFSPVAALGTASGDTENQEGDKEKKDGDKEEEEKDGEEKEDK